MNGAGETCKRRGKSVRKEARGERDEGALDATRALASELSAGLRIKTRGEFESGKVLNDFRRSCLASWFIRKSQFARRAGRTGARGTRKERKGMGEGRLCGAAARKSPAKLRRCFSTFA